MTLKVATIVGTRPEIIRLCRVIAKLDESLTHTLIHTGQNYDYELNQIFFEQLGIRPPDYYLDAAGNTPCETIAEIISKADKTLRIVKPDAVLILGDTNSCLASLAAKRLKIPIFHMEAGNRCFDQMVPEEINRKIVDHIADINLPYSSISREYLLREGIPPDRIVKTGSPMREILSHYLARIKESSILHSLRLKPRDFFLVSCHREENIDQDSKFRAFANLLNQLASEFEQPVIVSTHPRTRKRFERESFALDKRVSLLKPLGLFDYVSLQLESRATLSDSGTISEESSILNFPALNLRESHERPEAMEEASVMMVGLDWQLIKASIDILDSQKRGPDRTLRIPIDYCPENVSDKVLRIILSYTRYIERNVWKRRS
jgi:UDP-N-acetylglucosamine 2-epimerase (non-hydrolysing)